MHIHISPPEESTSFNPRLASFFSSSSSTDTSSYDPTALYGFLTQSWPSTPVDGTMTPTPQEGILLEMAPGKGNRPLDTLLWACMPATPTSFLLPSPVEQLDSPVSALEWEVQKLMTPVLSADDTGRSSMTSTPLLTPPEPATPMMQGVMRKSNKKKVPLPPKINTNVVSVQDEFMSPSVLETPQSATPATESDIKLLDTLLTSTAPSVELPTSLATSLYSHIPTSSSLPPPRPPNAFILYRRHQSAHLRRQFPGTHLRIISRVVSKWWKEAGEVERGRWRGLAEDAKKEHTRRWPGYRYRPKAELASGMASPVTPKSGKVRGSGGKEARSASLREDTVMEYFTSGMDVELAYDDTTGGSGSAPWSSDLATPLDVTTFDDWWQSMAKDAPLVEDSQAFQNMVMWA